MTERVVSIKITSDGRAFVGDQAANAAAVAKLEKELVDVGAALDTFIGKTKVVPAATAPVADGLKKTGDEADKTKVKLKQTGDAAEQAARQMRQVAPQITDVVTQLAGGQSPMQIFIQQGGQLKDVFGGVGPAARAVGIYIGGMINPVTVAGAAVGVLALAAHQGQQESAELTHHLVMSGEAAGVSASRYRLMADGIAAISGTKGAALQALMELAEQGRVGGDQLQRYAGIAARLDSLVGKPVADTAKEFRALGEEPVQASAKLTQQYNYLTAATYNQIKALVDQGKFADAANLAQQTYASAMEARIPRLEASLGIVERAWRGVKGAAKDAWDAMLGIGRADTFAEQLAKANDRARAAIQQAPNIPPEVAQRAAGLLNRPLVPSISAEQESARELVRLERQAAEGAANRREQLEATTRLEKVTEESLAKQVLLDRAIAKIREDGKLAGWSPDAIEQTVAAERKKTKYVDGDAQAARQDALAAQITAARRSAELEAVRSKDLIASIAEQRKLGAISEVESIQLIGAAEVAQMRVNERQLEEQIASATLRKNSRQEVADLEGQLAKQRVERGIKEAQIEREIANSIAAKNQAAMLFYVNEQQQTTADRNKAISDEYERVTAARLAIGEYVRALAEEREELTFQASILGKTSEEQARAIELRRVDLRLRQQLRDLDKENLPAAEHGPAEARIRAAAAEDAANVSTKIWVEKWRGANSDVAESFYSVITRRGDDARRRLINVFENMVLRPMVMPTLQAGANYVTSALIGSPGGGGGLVGSVANSAAGSAIASSLGIGSMGGLFSGAGAYAAAVPGLTSAAAGSQAAMLAAQTEVFGAAGLASTAAAGGSGAAAALAAIPGWGWAALGATALFGSGMLGGKRGGAKQDGRYGYIDARLGSGTYDSTVAAAVLARQTQYDALVRRYNGVGGLKFGAGVSTDPSGTSPSFVDVTTSRDGRTVRTKFNPNVGRDEAALQAALAQQLTEQFVQAVQDADLRGGIGDALRELGDVANHTGDEISAMADRINKATQERATLEERLLQATETDVQKLVRVRQAERDAIDDTNRAKLAEVYAAEDLISLRSKLQDAYGREQQQLQSAVDEHRRYADELRQFRDELRFGASSPLSSIAKSADAQQRFEAIAAGTAKGDLKEAARTWLDSLLASSTSGTDYAFGFAKVQAALSIAAISEDSQATIAQEHLDVAKSTLDQLGILTETVQTFAQALSAYNAGRDAYEAAKIAAGAADLSYVGSRVVPATASTVAPEPVGFTGWVNVGGEGGGMYLVNGVPSTPPMDYGGFASGGAFSDGVVMRPATFDMARIGENNAEAIMPLANVGGRLGVRGVLPRGADGNSAATLQGILQLQRRQQYALDAMATRFADSERHLREIRRRGNAATNNPSGEILKVQVVA